MFCFLSLFLKRIQAKEKQKKNQPNILKYFNNYTYINITYIYMCTQ